jgi:hypothetical protein
MIQVLRAPADWAEQQFGGLDFGDGRLSKAS